MHRFKVEEFCARKSAGEFYVFHFASLAWLVVGCLQGFGGGPKAAMHKLLAETPRNELRNWASEAHSAALLGSCPRSHRGFASATRSWAAFARHVFQKDGREFPPTARELVIWSRCFRCAGTFGNYLGHIRLGCQLLGVDGSACSDPSVRRAKSGIVKSGAFKSRPRLFIKEDEVQKLVGIYESEGEPADWKAVMLFLATYVFLLRLPSEALHMTRGSSDGEPKGHPAIIRRVDENTVELRLARRKNLPNGSVLRRKCWCGSSPRTCPVHRVFRFFEDYQVGIEPFAAFSPAQALKRLRVMCNELAWPRQSYTAPMTCGAAMRRTLSIEALRWQQYCRQANGAVQRSSPMWT